MAALTSASVTYALQKKTVGDGPRNFLWKLTFGDNASTYPTGGIPLIQASLGVPNALFSIVPYGNSAGDGYLYKIDPVALTIRIYQSPTHTHDVLLKNAAVVDGATTRVNAGANLLGANTGSDITVTGGGANGGVKTVASQAFIEATTAFVPGTAVVLYVEVKGW